MPLLALAVVGGLGVGLGRLADDLRAGAAGVLGRRVGDAVARGAALQRVVAGRAEEVVERRAIAGVRRVAGDLVVAGAAVKQSLPCTPKIWSSPGPPKMRSLP